MANITDPRISASTRALLQALAQDSGTFRDGAITPHPMPAKMHGLSFIITVLNEREAIRDLYTRIALICCVRNMPYEIIYVDKCSTDGSWEEMTKLSAGKNHICALQIKQESNQSQAMAAGFQHVNGNILFMMKAGTDNPAAISSFIAKMEEGYDVVYELSESEQNWSLIRILAGWRNWLTGRQSHPQTSYICYNAKMIRHLFRTTRLQGKRDSIEGFLPLRGCRVCEIRPGAGLEVPTKKGESGHAPLSTCFSLILYTVEASIGVLLLMLCLAGWANGTPTADSHAFLTLPILSVLCPAAVMLPRSLSPTHSRAIPSRCAQSRTLNCVKYRHNRKTM